MFRAIILVICPKSSYNNSPEPLKQPKRLLFYIFMGFRYNYGEHSCFVIVKALGFLNPTLPETNMETQEEGPYQDCSPSKRGLEGFHVTLGKCKP